MLRRLCLCLAVLGALSVAPAAAGDGPGPYALQGGPGVLSRLHGGPPLRYVTIGANASQDTLLEAIQTNDGQIRSWTDIAGAWGIPAITYGDSSSLSHDGKTLVLGETQSGSSFLVYALPSMNLTNSVVLKGSFAFDALSPDASRMYLIQYTQASSGDLSHYIVRAYDLKKNRLLPGRIADRTQKSWVMNGYPMTRTSSADGRWVYTLYQNGGNGYPFIHALDTVRGVAHCVGLPMTNGLYNIVLSLHGWTLAVHWRSGRPWLDVNTATWRVSPAHGAFPWLWAGLGAGSVALLVSAAGALVLVRRRAGEELEQELADLLRLPKHEVMV
jgi:hypothetical protein